MSVKTNVEEMLVEKGIITRAQLERVKKVQFDHRDKSLSLIHIRRRYLLLLHLLSEEIMFSLYVLQKESW